MPCLLFKIDVPLWKLLDECNMPTSKLYQRQDIQPHPSVKSPHDFPVLLHRASVFSDKYPYWSASMQLCHFQFSLRYDNTASERCCIVTVLPVWRSVAVAVIAAFMIFCIYSSPAGRALDILFKDVADKMVIFKNGLANKMKNLKNGPYNHQDLMKARHFGEEDLLQTRQCLTGWCSRGCNILPTKILNASWSVT